MKSGIQVHHVSNTLDTTTPCHTLRPRMAANQHGLVRKAISNECRFQTVGSKRTLVVSRLAISSVYADVCPFSARTCWQFWRSRAGHATVLSPATVLSWVIRVRFPCYAVVSCYYIPFYDCVSRRRSVFLDLLILDCPRIRLSQDDLWHPVSGQKH